MAATRRHGKELVRAIHEAVLAEVAEHGYAATTYEGIATRAGTSKPVLYRRWPTKASMVLDAFLEASPGLTVPSDTGSLSGDLKAFLRNAQSMMERAGRQTLLSLLAELGPSAGEAVRELLFARGADIIGPLLLRPGLRAAAARRHRHRGAGADPARQTAVRPGERAGDASPPLGRARTTPAARSDRHPAAQRLLFDGAAITQPIVVLVVWAVLGLAAYYLAGRRHRARQPFDIRLDPATLATG